METEMPVMQRLWDFENFLRARGLIEALRYLPADVRYARRVDAPHGARLDNLLPSEYRDFVAAMGYPVIATAPDSFGFSFLPPEPMAVMSVELPDHAGVFPDSVEGEPAECRHAFFAGSDLTSVQGYSFGPTDDGEIVVWIVEDGEPVLNVGPFTSWLMAELDVLEDRIARADAAELETLREKAARVTDPHGVLAQSLGSSYDQASYTVDDLKLNWVVDRQSNYLLRSRAAHARAEVRAMVIAQNRADGGNRPADAIVRDADDPAAHLPVASYGLIDAAGNWRIPIGNRFDAVLPFRDGVARVIPHPRPDLADPWITIGSDGAVLT